MKTNKEMLIVCISSSPVNPLADKALELAKREKISIAKLIYIIDETIYKQFSTWLMYMGFLGHKLTDEIREIILAEAETEAKEICSNIQQKFAKMNIPVTLLILYSSLSEVYKKIASHLNVDVIIAPSSLRLKEIIPSPRKTKVIEL